MDVLSHASKFRGHWILDVGALLSGKVCSQEDEGQVSSVCDMTLEPTEAISVLDLKRVRTSSAARLHLQNDFTVTKTKATMWTQLELPAFLLFSQLLGQIWGNDGQTGPDPMRKVTG